MIKSVAFVIYEVCMCGRAGAEMKLCVVSVYQDSREISNMVVFVWWCDLSLEIYVIYDIK